MTRVIAGPIAVCANQAWNLVNFRAGLIRALIARGFSVVAIAPPDAEMERRLADMGCAFEPVEIDSAGLSPLRDFATFFAFRRAIARHKPAAWLSWTIKPNVYGSLAARLAGVPAFPNVSGLGTAFIRQGLLTQIAKRLYRTGFARAHRVFFQNTDDRDLFVALGMVRAGQTALLPGSGIDANHWAPASDERPGPNRFLMIARVVADKGVREYAEAAKAVRAHLPEARFALMGPLDVANRTAIARDEVERWQDEGAIEYLPPADDVRAAVNAADWIVLPSYREGLSRVLLEAAAMARPIVTTDVPGCRDVVTDGVNGFLCEARDTGSLAASLERAAACDDSRWRAMGQAGRERVRTEFSQERVTQLYLEALDSAGIVPPVPT
ncbi:glycosyltransferase family 4 protein [Novosphingobium sp.]|uniref:glycosyltransferase family 4 protein n=1 Tax=Novosphingobium sp. TaxID=1874826 RepID=UPI00286DAA41|nr:glycosyltransferase family 4 protein [Novosphingobium sp.]